MNVIDEVEKDRKTMASSAAAAVTIGPVRSSPSGTAWAVGSPASCASLIRESRKTS